MRSAGNLHPEWGYLAPPPSFMRTVRIVVVATAVGATAGAGVVLTLAERSPQPDESGKVVVVRSLVQPAEAAIAAPIPGAPATASTPVPPAAIAPVRSANVAPSPAPASVAPMSAPAASDSHTASTPESPTGIAALSESPPVSANEAAPRLEAAAPDQPPAPKSKKRRVARRREPQGYGVPFWRRAGNFGPMLQRLFSARGPSYYQN